MLRFRHAVLLRPVASDGDIIRVSLGARIVRFAPGHGLLIVDGEIGPLLAVSPAVVEVSVEVPVDVPVDDDVDGDATNVDTASDAGSGHGQTR